MEGLVSKFFKDFLKKRSKAIAWFSFWRMASFAQVLFWPYALSRVLDILSQGLNNWKAAVPWVVGMTVNKIVEDFIRLRSKHGLVGIGSELRLSLTTHFTEHTQLKEGAKTGEAIQRIKRVSETVKSAVNYYKNSFLGIPVNLILIPVILSGLYRAYLLIFLVYIILYLVIDYFATSYYQEESREYSRASEVFWGTAYRKTPDMWRERVDGEKFQKQLDQEADDLYKEIVTLDDASSWRWTALQSLSSLAKGFALIFVFLRVINGEAQIGDFVLIGGYLTKTQANLNRITSSVTRYSNLKISFHRLSEVLKPREDS